MPPTWPPSRPMEVENKGQYFVKMTQACELERQMWHEQERRLRVYQIRLKGKMDELARRREQLSLREAARRKSFKLVRQLSRTRVTGRRVPRNNLQGVIVRGNNHATPSRKDVIDSRNYIP